MAEDCSPCCLQYIHTTTLQPAAGGIFRGQRGAESGEGGEGDTSDRCVALRPAEGGGRSRKLGGGGGKRRQHLRGGPGHSHRDVAIRKSWGGAGLLTPGPLANTIQ